MFPGLQVAVKPEIGEPLLAGGVKKIVACALPGVAVTPVGAPGKPAGVTFWLADGGPLPAALVAKTLHAVDTPLVRPVTISGEPWPVFVMPPQLAVYCVMALPPSDAGGVKLTVA